MAPREIADSDEDDDHFIEDGQAGNDLSTHVNGISFDNSIGLQILPPGDEVNFSQFLSQSQSYNGFASSNQAEPLPQQNEDVQIQCQSLSPTQPFSTSVHPTQNLTVENGGSSASTERVRRDIEQMQERFFEGDSSLIDSRDSEQTTDHRLSNTARGSGKRKRTRSNPSRVSSQQSADDEGLSRKKRSRNSDTRRSNQGSSMPSSPMSNTVQNDSASMFIDPMRLQGAMFESTTLDMAQPILGYEQNVSSEYRSGVRAIQSSVGGHQTLTLTDPNHNPFADEANTLSREIDHSARIAEIFRPFQKTSSDGLGTTVESAGDESHIEEPMPPNTISSQSKALETSLGQSHSHHDTEALSTDQPTSPRIEVRIEPTLSKSRKSTRRRNSIDERETADSIIEEKDGQSEIPAVQPQSKKRGRKPKSKSGPIHEEDENLDVEEKNAEASSRKDIAADVSPVKNLSSEINLSDEAFIGLPKDQYVPRPSRYGRGASKKIEQEEMEKIDDILSQSSRKSRETDRELTAEQEESMLPPPPKRGNKKQAAKKKGRKGKTKVSVVEADTPLEDGQDTSTLLDREQLSVDSKEQVQVEEEPNTIQADSRDKIEDEKPEDSEHVDAQTPSTIKADVDATELCQDQANAQNNNRESPEPTKEPPKVPKKRGRKRKPSPEPVVKDDSVAEEEANNEDDTTVDPVEADTNPNLPATTSDRLPLKAKSLNISTPSPAPDSKQLSPAESTKPSPTPAQEVPLQDQPPTNPDEILTPASKPTPTTASAPNSTMGGIKYRVGLSKRAHIPSLLSRVRRDSSTPPVAASEKKKK